MNYGDSSVSKMVKESSSTSFDYEESLVSEGAPTVATTCTPAYEERESRCYTRSSSRGMPLTSILKRRENLYDVSIMDIHSNDYDGDDEDQDVKFKVDHRVRWTHPLVTQIYLRPRTKSKYKAKLFYTSQEYSQFRGEYRAFIMEQRRLQRVQQARKNPPTSTSTLHRVLSFASQFITGLDVPQSSSASPQDENCLSHNGEDHDEETTYSPAVTASELYDVLYLY